jgi:hypothetical protein
MLRLYEGIYMLRLYEGIYMLRLYEGYACCVSTRDMHATSLRGIIFT